MGHPHLQVSPLFFYRCLKLHHHKGYQEQGGASSTSKLVVVFQGPMGSIDQTLIQISREGSTKRDMGILFVLLIIKKNKVCWDGGQEQEVFSNCLSKELPFAALPPDIPPSLQ